MNMANKKPTGQCISEVPAWPCWDEARCVVRCESRGSLCAVVVQTKPEAAEKGIAAVPFAGCSAAVPFLVSGQFKVDSPLTL